MKHGLRCIQCRRLQARFLSSTPYKTMGYKKNSLGNSRFFGNSYPYGIHTRIAGAVFYCFMPCHCDA